jgi:hypothetical protein
MIAFDKINVIVTPRTLCRAIATGQLMTPNDRIIVPKAVSVRCAALDAYSPNKQSLVVAHDLVGGRPCHIAASVMLSTYYDDPILVRLYNHVTNTYLGLEQYMGFGWNTKSKVANFQYTQPIDGEFSIRAEFQLGAANPVNAPILDLVLAVFP